MSDQRLTAEQDRALQQINDSWGVATYEKADDGSVKVTLEDGDEAVIDSDGKWELSGSG